MKNLLPNFNNKTQITQTILNNEENMNFLPEDYEAPKMGGSFMKIQTGENKIRILSQPILGWEEWTKDKKPVRYRFDKRPDKPIDPKQPPRHFWAFIVWNYTQEAIQILHVTQAGIRKGIEALCNDADWGPPFGYDIKIIKEGEELKTKYMVNPLPHKPVSLAIAEAFNEKPCWLDALFTNDDPFSMGKDKRTPPMFNIEGFKTESPKSEFIEEHQVAELETILEKCDPKYRDSVWTTLAKPPLGVTDLHKLPMAMYERIKAAAIKKMDEFQKSTNDSVDWILEG